MTREIKNKHRNLPIKNMRRVDWLELDKATAALSLINAPSDVAEGLMCIAGADRPLSTPCGADLSVRCDLANALARGINRQCKPDEVWHFLSFELQSDSWDVPAHRPHMRLREMHDSAIKHIKKRFNNIAFAPTVRLVKRADKLLMMRPIMRVIVLEANPNDTDVNFIAGLQQRLNPLGREEASPVTFQPVELGTIVEQTIKLLRLVPSNTISGRQTDKPSSAAKLSSLYRVMILGTLPLKHIAGGSGRIKTALRLAQNEVKTKAHSRAAAHIPPVAPNEVHAVLGDIPLVLNDVRVRLPYFTN